MRNLMRFFSIGLLLWSHQLAALEPAVAAAEAADLQTTEDVGIELASYFSAELVAETISSGDRHLVPLGSLEKVNRVLEPEASVAAVGKRTARTYYLPAARRTDDVIDFYRAQLETFGELTFECDGRTCGSSSYWANRIFGMSVLYGPEQYQRYAVARNENTGDYLLVYVGQRATRAIYVQIDSIEVAPTD